jgi:hypothetical protein
MTKEQIIERLLEIREDAVYGQIVRGKNDNKSTDWHFEWGREDAVCRILNELRDAGDITHEQSIAAFERGRDRGWDARKESE